MIVLDAVGAEQYLLNDSCLEIVSSVKPSYKSNQGWRPKGGAEEVVAKKFLPVGEFSTENRVVMLRKIPSICFI